MNDVKNPILAPNKIFAVVLYFLITFIIGGIIIIVVAYIYGNNSSLIETNELLKALANSEFLSKENIESVDKNLLKAYSITNALGNMISYLLALGAVGFFMRDHIINDARDFKHKFKFLLWFIPLSTIIFYGLSIGIEVLVSLGTSNVSENQNSIVYMILEGGAIPTFIAVVICAPLVEELIYRKAIFEFLKGKKIVLSYIVSTLIFALPHMITTPLTNPGEWLLMSIPYLASGIMLCAIYHLSGKNIYASWFAHLVNNLVAFIQISVSLGVFVC